MPSLAIVLPTKLNFIKLKVVAKSEDRFRLRKRKTRTLLCGSPNNLRFNNSLLITFIDVLPPRLLPFMGDGNAETRLDGATGPRLGGSFAPANPPYHKRNSTGSTGLSSSFLSRFTFSRMNPPDTSKTTHGKAEGEEEADGDESGGGSDSMRTTGQQAGVQRLKVPDRAMASVLNQQRRKTRRRKGSLRKTALLGTGILRMEGKERFASGGTTLKRATGIFLDQYDGTADMEEGKSRGKKEVGNDGDIDRKVGSVGSQGNQQLSQLQRRLSASFEDGESTPRRSYSHSNTLAVDHDDSPSASPSPWNQNRQQQEQQLRRSLINNGSFSSTTQEGQSSAANSVQDDATTDDEDGLSLPRLNTSNFSRLSTKTSNSSISTSPIIPPLHMPLSALQTAASSSSDSFFKHPGSMAQISRSASQRIRSPLATSNTAEITSPSEIWDYSETEWWGWIILIVTWLVFVVGMGSCLGVWSWAWDVGETPYAPPELEDDATLPIVGYYPALIVLTAVMAWVWVIVAWVGMKYFRHANISGDDT
ncbi:hypothetical protein MGYG_03340 [Nannizzia gypsea CBS 118893]|uniref:Uncharacterized protein n=1 Tax=Arthroderma gypseum (strain ATCC MYA-4604 / CBS 118893) TaxID=535722 RepID=E4UN36_ARTGP|nr:hypothetical protein MGYG_03340 [Nannizzia gypsea CBS 118893]EFR00338.1 hypothetical protein MGYG_03340 [Nannizzia gypsea CBS 118893]